jgi:hypothetical protein
MSGGQVVQFVLKEELKHIAEADAKKFEHIKLGNVTVLGGTDTVPGLLSGIVKAVESVNTLKENVPGAAGLLGMLDSFDKNHATKPEPEPETEPEPTDGE